MPHERAGKRIRRDRPRLHHRHRPSHAGRSGPWPAARPARLAQGQETRMKIGIIGAGNIGGTLTRRLTALGHEVAVANSRGPQTLADLASETGARAVSVSEVAPGADLVIVTIPEIRVPDLPSGLFQGVPDDLIVVDTGNYYPRQRDGEIEEIEAGLPESRWVERQLHHPVIKAFNNIYAQHLAENGRPAGTPGRIALPVAGDDPRAKAVVMDLVDELGFDSVDTGGLDESWRQQPGSPVYTADKDAEGVKRALADADRQRTPDWQATPDSPGTFETPA
ncbi:NADPH-dependent F420 reductase [Streptomyces sp. NPDC058330]|uniref:NADPH-dependent F420 reductase n=1 Tax=Streptomyces sp. NPDC058330 TaxID=3346449 RepID=UPI0036F16960